MKKFFSILLALCLLCAAASAESVQDRGKQLRDTAERKKLAEADAVITQLKESIGEELWEQAKAEGLELVFWGIKQVYAPRDGQEPDEDDFTEDCLSLQIMLRTTVDFDWENPNTDIMYQLYNAIVDSPVFDLTDEDRTALKAACTKEIDFEEWNVHRIEKDGRYSMRANEHKGGFDNDIMLYISPFMNHSGFMHDAAWQARYLFDELTEYHFYN